MAGERAIEIPITRRMLNKYTGKNILEVGNVMSHYYPINHDVLDKYEKATGVINEDVVDFKPKKKYDLIISISTMEHVGYLGDKEKNPRKFELAFTNLKSMLKTGGLIWVSFPLYFNPYLTKTIKKRKSLFNKEYFLERTSFLNEWKETNFEEAIRGVRYDSYFANANILYIGEYWKD